MLKSDIPLTKEQIQKLQGRYSYTITIIGVLVIFSMAFATSLLVKVGVVILGIATPIYCIIQIDKLDKKLKQL